MNQKLVDALDDPASRGPRRHQPRSTRDEEALSALNRHCRITFETVREIGLKLPGVEVGTAYGSPMLRANGRIFTGIAVNRQAEPDSLMVYVSDFEERDALLQESPDIYYLKPHYESYPVVLVRLRQVTRDALEDLLRGAHRIVSSKPPRRARARKAATRRRR